MPGRGAVHSRLAQGSRRAEDRVAQPEDDQCAESERGERAARHQEIDAQRQHREQGRRDRARTAAIRAMRLASRRDGRHQLVPGVANRRFQPALRDVTRQEGSARRSRTRSTSAFVTPSTRIAARSTRFAQAAQLMPRISNERSTAIVAPWMYGWAAVPRQRPSDAGRHEPRGRTQGTMRRALDAARTNARRRALLRARRSRPRARARRPAGRPTTCCSPPTRTT